jgi:transposase-like protein
MSRPISTDLRERPVLAVLREGISARAAAARFGVSVSSAIAWVRRHRETGNVTPGKVGGYKPNILSGTHGDRLVERAKSDLTLHGLVAELAETSMAPLRGWATNGVLPGKGRNAKLHFLVFILPTRNIITCRINSCKVARSCGIGFNLRVIQRKYKIMNRRIN